MDKSMESPPQEKSTYELAWDENVARVREMLQPALATRANMDKPTASARPPKCPTPEDSHRGAVPPVRRKTMRRGLQGHSMRRTRVDEDAKMSSGLEESSGGTKSDYEFIATERSKFDDSSDDEDDLEQEEPTLDRRSKRNKRVPSSSQRGPTTSHPPASLGPDGYAPPGSVWVLGHYVQPQLEATSPLTRWPSAQRSRSDSENTEDRLGWRKRKKDYDLSSKL